MKKEIKLKPVFESKVEIDELDRMIFKLIKEEIYYPILATIKESPKIFLNNSTSPLANAIRDGKIKFVRGKFIGRFSSQVSKELKKIGATWDKKTGSFKIQLKSLPQEYKIEINVSQSYFQRMIQKIDETLSKIIPEKIADKINAANIFNKSLFKIDKDLQDSVKKITISQPMKAEDRERIALDHNTNLRKEIKDFSDKEITRIRKSVFKSVSEGKRAETLVETIQKDYQVSANKAKFIARQEVKMAAVKFKEARYRAYGFNYYRWKIMRSSGHQVRHDHKILDGHKFSWDDPPITDQKTGRRNHPGEDYNCFCYAEPVIED